MKHVLRAFSSSPAYLLCLFFFVLWQKRQYYSNNDTVLYGVIIPRETRLYYCFSVCERFLAATLAYIIMVQYTDVQRSCQFLKLNGRHIIYYLSLWLLRTNSRRCPPFWPLSSTLLFLTLQGKETNFRRHKLITQNKVQKNNDKIKKDPEKVPTLARKIWYRFLKMIGSEKHEAG